ncbi:MAG: HAMP domain-containing histidine kinase [Actinomycetota bacterium]|nr:MAG: HAMP domain-containing histidine kinase [Actinomycetota bacterium]
MAPARMTLGLRARVALAFGVLSLVVSVVVAGATYAFARYYLVSQREASSLTRALVDGRAVEAALTSGAKPGTALETVPTVGSSQALLNVDGTWFSRGVAVSPEDLPGSVLGLAATSGGSWQRFDVGGAPYLAVVLTVADGTYAEVFPLRDLDSTLTAIGWLLIVAGLAALIIGAAVGALAAQRLLRPLRALAAGAQLIARGDLSARVAVVPDPDLGSIAVAFNEMADAVQSRIARESRFAANVSHELRSPLTSVVGTAELLHRRRDALPQREARLVVALHAQVGRMSQTLLDLLELSRIGNDAPVQADAVDLAALIRELLTERNLPVELLSGSAPLVRSDARRVERIIGNLLDNAVRHGGGLRQVTLALLDEEVLVYVDDAGPGVPEAERAAIFEPFHRGQLAAGPSGAGLGLALVREQATALGGSVAVTTSPQGGARFTVRLPRELP